MILKIFTVRDAKANAFLPPWCIANRAMAIREFETAVNDPKSNLGKYPEDYALYECGAFDDNVGQIEVAEPRFVIQGASLVKRDTQTRDLFEEQQKEVA